ncbi:MAG: hypothetical protein WCO06_03640 [Candidatus Roizmanbacteria bacterium]
MTIQKKSLSGKKTILTIVTSSIFITILLLSTYTTIAQTFNPAQTLEISPPTQDLETDPGKEIVIKSKIRNRTANILNMKVHLEDIVAQEDQGQIALVNRGSNSISRWGGVKPETFSLEAGAEQEVIATLKIPSKNVAGGQYGAFVFSTVSKQTANTASVNQEIASLFLVRVSGEINENIQSVYFQTPPFQEYGPVPMTLKLKNTGNVFVKITGLISVTDMLGNKVADVVIPPTNILNSAERIITTPLKNIFLLGRYQATAIIYYGSKNDSLTITTSFFAFPIKLASIIAGILLVIWFMRKRLNKALKAFSGK